MAFWGIEVKPGTPITHRRATGRLHISQATLGLGEAFRKVVLQCNVGNRSPVLLCILVPNKTETCLLNLEFEEAVDVVFSVIGPRCIFLSGYYVQQNRHINSHSDSESHGEDLEDTETDGSSYHSEDDAYEDDSFIDDDDELRVIPESPVLSNKGIDEVSLEEDMLEDRKCISKQLNKKKYRAIVSDDDANSHEGEGEDEDGLSLSAPNCKRGMETTLPDAGEMIAKATVEIVDETKVNGVCGCESKQMVEDPQDSSGKLERVTQELQDAGRGNEINHSLPPMLNGEDQMQSLDLAQPKKKRKECPVEEEKTSRIQTNDVDHSVVKEDKEHDVERSTMGISENQSKKLKSELQLEGKHIEGIGAKHCSIPPEQDMLEQGLLHPDSLIEDPPAANGEYKEQQRLEEDSTERIDAKCHNLPGQDEVKQEAHADITAAADLATGVGEYQEQEIDRDIKSELQNNQVDKKIKKKKKRSRDESELSKTRDDTIPPMKHEDQTTKQEPIQRITLPNGMIIEQLASGPADGKVAAPGKKVKIYYTAMLKESGRVFESNVGKAACRFRLGDEEYIDGWNVGIEGMHVGDKRRLIIPPTMGFGDGGGLRDVPPNSWLSYEVELVGVRK